MNKEHGVAERMQHIQPFYVMDILARAHQLEAAGKTVIHLEVGEPDFPTPPAVKQAAKQAIDNDLTRYTAATGLVELRQAISSYYRQHLAASVDAQNIIITPGASGALQLALSVVVNPGQKVLMADPGYPCNRHFVRLLEGRARSIAVGAEHHYQLNSELIAAHWDQDSVAVLLASPSNPTGSLIDAEEMGKIIQQVKRLKGVLLVDEIYQGLIYEQPDYSAAALSSDIFVINSFSKFFCMTGWRLGWLIVPDGYRQAVDRLAQNIYLAAPTISQYAALAAFKPETLAVLASQRDELKKRRDFLLAGLQSLGFEIPLQPRGAFYIYADIRPFASDSFAFCHQLLEQAHVAITPGIDFGEYQAGSFVRFAYTQPVEKLQQALDRIRAFLTL